MLAGFFVAGYGAIGYRLVGLHAFKSTELVSELERSRFRVLTEMPSRGDILDTRGEMLATSRIFLEVGVDRRVVEQRDIEAIPLIAEQLDVSEQELRSAFGLTGFASQAGLVGVAPRWKLIKRRVDPKDFAPIKDLKLRSVTATREYVREYPQGSLASHILGYVRKDGQAAMGIERAFDYYLSGEEGWTETEIGARRKEMAQFRRRRVSPTDGLNVVLTIDSYVQHAVERELQEIARSLKPEAATIIVSDPYTGEILGLGNYPSFDPNRYGSYGEETRKNRALTDVLEPGSTFKIVAATAALEEGVVQPDTLIDCASPVAVMPDGYAVRLPKDDHPMGLISVSEVIAKSSNRGAAQLGFRLGERRFYDWVSRYGFGEQSGLDLGAESRGILNSPDRWDRLTLSRMTMGHSIAATPLQIHFATATLANGGTLMRPRVVAGIVDDEGGTVAAFGPSPRRRVFSRDTAALVTSLLEKAASAEGTAPLAAIEGFRVAGKTGTTQKIVDGQYSSQHHVGSFTGFFPADDPRIVMTIVVDGARRANGRPAYGSVVAAPSFRRIGLELIPHYAIAPSSGHGGFAYRLGSRQAQRISNEL